MTILKFVAKTSALIISILIFLINQFISQCIPLYQLDKIEDSNIVNGICHYIGMMISSHFNRDLNQDLLKSRKRTRRRSTRLLHEETF